MIHKLCRDTTHGALEAQLRYITEHESESRVAILVNQRNSEKYSPLHSALFARNLAAVELLVGHGADVNAKCHGIPPLHLALRTAAQPEGLDFGLAAFEYFLSSGANALAKDDNGQSVLHLVSAYNLTRAFDALVQHGLVAKLLNVAPKLTGLTPLHAAALNDSAEVAKLLLENGAQASLQLAFCRSTAAHLAAQSQSARVFELLAKLAPDSCAILNSRGEPATFPSSKQGRPPTVLVTSSRCLQHHTCPPSQLRSTSAPPENVRRLQLLIDQREGALRSLDLQNRVSWVENAELAPIADVLRIHDWSYVRLFQSRCLQLGADAEAENGMGGLDADTAISRGTYDAALGAAGSVCRAVDEVLLGKARNAFCPVRPPGHHAGPRGVVRSATGSDSHGFCFFNNISIGAAYAMNRYRDKVRKVAIVDFDVHHGNGTEETVRYLQPLVEEAQLQEDFCFGRLYSPQYRPWFGTDDSKNVLFVSVHGYGPRERGLEHMFPMAAFYPGTGATKLPHVQSASDEQGNCPPGFNTLPVNSVEGQTSSSHNNTQIARDGEGKEIEEELEEEEDNDDEEDMEVGSNGEDEDSEDREGDQRGESSDDDSDESWREEYSTPKPSSISLSGCVSGDSIDRLRHLYSQPSESSTTIPDARARQLHNTMKPLILDIGVSLPTQSSEDTGLEATALSKAIDEFSYRLQWRNYFRQEIFPRLLSFQPDLILISAGFDAHKRDTINAGYISLVDDDYTWVTSRLAQIAESCCEGRLVSVLEGGYQLGGEYASAFARSVHDHVQSLALAASSEIGLSESALQVEQQNEEALLAQMKERRREEMEAEALYQQQLAEERERAELGSQPAEQPEATVDPQVETSEAAGRKRKRPAVDYAALDLELRKAESQS